MAKRKFKLSKKEFEKLYLIEKLSPKEIAQKAGTTHWMVYIWRRKYNIPKRKYVPWNKGTKGLMPSGKNHSQWKGGRHQVKSGYILKR